MEHWRLRVLRLGRLGRRFSYGKMDFTDAIRLLRQARQDEKGNSNTVPVLYVQHSRYRIPFIQICTHPSNSYMPPPMPVIVSIFVLSKAIHTGVLSLLKGLPGASPSSEYL